MAALVFVFTAFTQTDTSFYITRLYGYGAGVSHGVPVYSQLSLVLIMSTLRDG